MTAYQSASLSVTGDRANNEDYCIAREQTPGWVLLCADGLGGYDHGEWASELFCEALADACQDILERLVSADEAEARTLVTDWYNAAAALMRAEVQRRDARAEPHTTMAAALVLPATVVISHIGDSRVYRLSPRRRPWRTRDHSVVQMLLDEGDITEAQMGTHRDQGKLLRSVSMAGALVPTVSVQAGLAPGEALLLCSDGLWERLDEGEIRSLRSAEITQQLPRLTALAVQRSAGESDNVSAVCFYRDAHSGWLGKVLSWLR